MFKEVCVGCPFKHLFTMTFEIYSIYSINSYVLLLTIYYFRY